MSAQPVLVSTAVHHDAAAHSACAVGCRRLWLQVLPVLLLSALAPHGLAEPRAALVISADSPDLFETAFRLGPGDALRIEGLTIVDLSAATGLDLERMVAFSRDVEVVIDGESRRFEAASAYFRGYVSGSAEHAVVLTVPETGGARGLIFGRGEYWVLAEDRGSAGLVARKIDAENEFAPYVESFRALNDQLRPPAEEPVC